MYFCILLFFFFFQAEDGIRDLTVTGVQTCALPILFEFWLLVRAVRSTYFMVKICGDTSTKRPLPKSYLDHPTVSQALSPIQAQPTCFAVAIWVLMLSGTEPSYQVGVPGSDAEPDRFHAANTA